MQTKIYNAYRITHKNGTIEDINAVDVVQALENMGTPETESKVSQVLLTKENVKTLVDEMPEEIVFTVVAEGSGNGSIATPAQGRIHVGDQITLKAIPAKNYKFKEWKMNGEVIGDAETMLYTIPTLEPGITSCMFVATFEIGDVTWQTKVSPVEASNEGCVAFPSGGLTKIGGTFEAIAVPAGSYQFDHWEYKGQSVSTNKILNTNVSPLSDGETVAEYVAVFTTT